MSLRKNESIVSILWRVFTLLDYSERKRSALLLGSILANTVVEILGLAILVPVIGLVVQPDTIQTNEFLNYAFDFSQTLGIASTNDFLIALCLLMIGAFLFKAMFGLFVNLFQTRFAFAMAHRLSGLLWTHHFTKSYEVMRSSNSGEILTEIGVWPIYFAQVFMVGGLLILTEITIVLIICGGLLVYNPSLFISITILLVAGAIVIRIGTKRRLSDYSTQRARLEPHTNTLVNNAIRGFLEILTFRASNAVRDAFLRNRSTLFRIQSNTTVLNFAPAKLYEVLAVMAVSGSIIISLLQDAPQSGFLQMLSLMAISAYRILPSMNRLNGAIMQMRGQMHVLETIERVNSIDKEQPPTKLESVSQLNLVEIQIYDLSLEYSTLDTPVIQGLTKTFRHGKIHCIVGPSGSGKSTLIGALLALHPTTSGKIVITSQSTPPLTLGYDFKFEHWMLNVGYLSQRPFLFEGTVRENLTLRVPEAKINERRVLRLIDTLGLRTSLGEHPFDFKIQEGGSNLSGGEQQRLALIRALQHPRAVLILDEATSALDSKMRDIVLLLLREEANAGCNVIIVTHDETTSENCDSVLRLNGN